MDKQGSDTGEIVSSSSQEKTIPFLRRLTDMLMENEGVISFQPGVRKSNGECAVGRIIVHDRLKVESDILPRYFNHASFASLRRQLNYFAFSRVGKGKQKGAIYCNERVIEINDILRLKRRTVGSTTTTTTTVPASGTISRNGSKQSLESALSNSSPQEVSPKSPVTVTVPSTSPKRNTSSQPSSTTTSSTTTTKKKSSQTKRRNVPKSKKSKRILDCLVPVVHLPEKKQKVVKEYQMTNTTKKKTPKLALDLTISSPGVPTTDTYHSSGENSAKHSFSSLQFPPLNQSVLAGSMNTGMMNSIFHSGSTSIMCSPTSAVKTTSTVSPPPETTVPSSSTKDNTDILAGCNALLSLGS